LRQIVGRFIAAERHCAQEAVEVELRAIDEEQVGRGSVGSVANTETGLRELFVEVPQSPCGDGHVFTIGAPGMPRCACGEMELPLSPQHAWRTRPEIDRG